MTRKPKPKFSSARQRTTQTRCGCWPPNAGISDDIVGFHAQQAVEKWLKAVLGFRGIKFEYTHDLRRLIAEVTAAVGDFPFDNAEVVALTEHAVPLRYDEILDSEPIDRDAILALVNNVGDWAAGQLSP